MNIKFLGGPGIGVTGPAGGYPSTPSRPSGTYPPPALPGTAPGGGFPSSARPGGFPSTSDAQTPTREYLPPRRS